MALCGAIRVFSRRLTNSSLRLCLRGAGPTFERGLVVASVLLALAALSAATPSLLAATQPLSVSYLGPSGRLSGLVTLHAASSARGARVVAVTFLCDGKPLGSDTTMPYQLDVDLDGLSPGSHQFRAEAVDSLDRRTTSAAIPVTVVPRPLRSLVASPKHGLRRALRRLAKGSVTVLLRPGHYRLSDVSLGSDSRLIGSGSSTVISAPSGPYDGILVVHGRHVRISGLSLDGSGPGRGDGQAVEIWPGAADVRISQVEITHARQTGVMAWDNYSDISVQDSTISGDRRAEAGVVFEDCGSSDSSVIRTRISGFRSYGINFACDVYNDPNAARDAVALDNVISDITDPTVNDGTSEGGIWSGGAEAALLGNDISRTGWDGIETVGSSLHATVVANTITATPTGIYLEHVTNHSLVSRNRISAVDTGIDVEWRYDGFGSYENSFSGNKVTAARRGLFVEVGDDGNRVESNTFIRVHTPVVFQGSSNNIARGNRACGNGEAVVTEGNARGDDGALVTPTGNRLSDNRSSRCAKLEAKK